MKVYIAFVTHFRAYDEDDFFPKVHGVHRVWDNAVDRLMSAIVTEWPGMDQEDVDDLQDRLFSKGEGEANETRYHIEEHDLC
jgi:hypothetical protein